jgi:hypothetical protein
MDCELSRNCSCKLSLMCWSFQYGFYGGPPPSYDVLGSTVPHADTHPAKSFVATPNAQFAASPPFRRDPTNGALIWTGVTWNPPCTNPAVIDAKRAPQIDPVKGWPAAIPDREEGVKKAEVAWLCASSRQVPPRPANTIERTKDTVPSANDRQLLAAEHSVVRETTSRHASTLSAQVPSKAAEEDRANSANAAPESTRSAAKKRVHWA